MSDQEPPQLTEEEIRQLEAELDRITVDDVLLQTIVSLINLAGRRAGLAAPGSTPDWEQTRQAIEGVRALLPLVEARHADKLGPIREALSQLQVVYARGTGGDEAAAESGPSQPSGSPPERPGGGRLWVPGQ
jgi:hypothetical protein